MKPGRGRDWLTLVRSDPGRLELRRRYSTRLWPAMAYVARAYRRTLGRRARIVAVVGSVGKTTTMRTVSAALARPVRRAALLNANSHAAVGRALLGIRPWQRHAVLEVAISGLGEMAIQARTVRPDVVVVTAIAHDHWQSFGTLEGTRDEKSDILRPLPPTAIVVANADDEHVRWMTTQTKARVILCGEAADADVRASNVTLNWPHGMSFTIHIDGVARPVQTKLVGRHMVFPALAAIVVGMREGVPLDEATRRVENVTPTPGRMQLMPLTSGAFALRDEFKASEDAFEAGLATLAEIPAKRKIGVIGEIAEESGRDAYRVVGRQAAFLDRVIFVGTTKNMQAFRAAAVKAGFRHDRVERAHNAHEALELVQGDLHEGDVLFIKGRWQQALGRVGLALAGRDVQCRADPCPFKRMLCDVCPFLEKEFYGLNGRPDSATAENP
jgi:UDP-N-acetylmuramoyl-tripeptide--D-alanyl-D-alanine ligase